MGKQIEASTRFELVHDGFADRSLTAWVRRLKKPPALKHFDTLNAKIGYGGYRAKDRIRTDDPNVGNVMLYQLSYFRINITVKKRDNILAEIKPFFQNN